MIDGIFIFVGVDFLFLEVLLEVICCEVLVEQFGLYLFLIQRNVVVNENEGFVDLNVSLEFLVVFFFDV